MNGIDVVPIERAMTHQDLPLLVAVTGPPGSGKTTLAEELARRLRLPLVTKDDLKETLFDALGTGDRAWSRRIGHASMDVLFLVLERQLAAGLPIVAESNFWRSHETERFRALPPHRLVQIHLSAPAHILLGRYTERERHPGHLGASVREEIAAALAAGEWEPLDLRGELVRLDTTSLPLDLEGLVESLGTKPPPRAF